MRDRSFNEKAIEKAEALVDEGYSKDKIYHILSEDYIDKSSLKMLVAKLDTKEQKQFRETKQRKMIAMAVGLVLIKIIWNVISGNSVVQEINLITIVIAWGIYDSVRGSRFEHLAIFVWVIVSIEFVRFSDKDIEDLYFLAYLGIFAIFTTILAFKWKKEMRNIEKTLYDTIE